MQNNADKMKGIQNRMIYVTSSDLFENYINSREEEKAFRRKVYQVYYQKNKIRVFRVAVRLLGR